MLLQGWTYLAFSAALWLAVLPAVLSLAGRPLLEAVLGLVRTTSPWKRDNSALATLFFMAVCGWNVQALVPGTTTVAAHMCVTSALAMVFFVGYLHPRFARLGGYATSFVVLPQMGAVLGTMLICIECVSLFARCFALSIRLCCNLLSGHVLLKCVLGAYFAGVVCCLADGQAVLGAGAGTALAGFLVASLVGAIMILETAVAVLQAYVFTTLVLTL